MLGVFSSRNGGGGPLFCMNIAARAVHSNMLTVPAGAQGLGGDGFAFMRVVAQTSPGSYTISLRGRLLEARSNLPLEPGSFLRVQLRNGVGQLQLVPESVRAVPLSQMLRFTEDSFLSGTIPQQLAQSFAALGLPVDGISGRLFSMMQQLGLRFDGRRMQRAYRIASQFPGRESQAAEVALLLLEKGMEADSAMVASLLSLLLGDGEGLPQNPEGQESSHGGLLVRSGSVVEDFGGVGRLVDALYGCGVDDLGSREGVLTMLNHLAPSSLHWIVIPFSLLVASGGEGAGTELLGNIRVLFDVDSKKLLKTGITAQSPSSQYAFMVYYGRTEVESVEYGPGGDGWQRVLEGLFPGVPVTCRPVEAMGLFCDPACGFASCNLEV